MAAEIFFESHLPDALRRVQEYVGEDGFVASLKLLRNPSQECHQCQNP